MSERRDGETETEGCGVPPWLMVKRAQAVTRRWNERYPERHVPVEWAEEAAHAFAMAETCRAPNEVLHWQTHGLEFTARMPLELIEAIWKGTPLP